MNIDDDFNCLKTKDEIQARLQERMGRSFGARDPGADSTQSRSLANSHCTLVAKGQGPASCKKMTQRCSIPVRPRAVGEPSAQEARQGVAAAERVCERVRTVLKLPSAPT